MKVECGGEENMLSARKAKEGRELCRFLNGFKLKMSQAGAFSVHKKSGKKLPAKEKKRTKKNTGKKKKKNKEKKNHAATEYAGQNN